MHRSRSETGSILNPRGLLVLALTGALFDGDGPSPVTTRLGLRSELRVQVAVGPAEATLSAASHAAAHRHGDVTPTARSAT